MAKRLGSVYLPGKRSPNWRKVKNRRTVEVVIGGYTPGAGNRAGTFGALLVGVADGRRPALRRRRRHRVQPAHARAISSHKLAARCAARRARSSPLPPREYSRDAIWVRPELRAIVEIAEFTNEGYVRHSSFIRSDRVRPMTDP